MENSKRKEKDLMLTEKEYGEWRTLMLIEKVRERTQGERNI